MNFNDYEKVNKKVARDLYYKGITIAVFPCNVRPDNMWIIPPFYLSLEKSTGADFNYVIDRFEYYNCHSKECGYYASYYVTKEDLLKSKMCDLMCN